MNPPIQGWIRIEKKEPIYIPNRAGDGIAHIIYITVPAWQDPESQQIFLDGEARDLLDAAKARHLGILSPDQLKALRTAFGETQKGMAELLQLGEKTWTRWESGKEKPSRSMNVLLCALFDGQIDIYYLRDLADHTCQDKVIRWQFPAVKNKTSPYSSALNHPWSNKDESTALTA